jgi:hypothetical protein
MKSIFVARVFTNLSVRYSESHCIGWHTSLKECENVLREFNKHEKWKYAMIAEVPIGIYTHDESQTWYMRYDLDWVKHTPEANTFLCF